MGIATARPEPTALKLIKGNPGKRAINHQEPQPTQGKPLKPPDLSAVASKKWDELAEILENMCVLTVADGSALAAMCEAFAELQEAREVLRRRKSRYIYQKMTNGGGSRLVIHPAVGVVQEADRRFKSYLIEFGLTPAARSRIKVPDGAGRPKQTQEQADNYFN